MATSSNESIGSFAAYIRRPKPSNSGYIANFFGENGDDADTISVLSLTQYMDVEVSVSVYHIKDAVGFDMKNPETKQYPLISSFIGQVKRPVPSEQGMTAQFFAPNGEYSDAVNKLGMSNYVDSLVFVDIRGKLQHNKINIYDTEIQENIVENHAWKVSEAEKKTYLSKIKRFTKYNLELHESDFLLNSNLLDRVNEEFPYKEYLTSNTCCYKHYNKMCEHRENNKLLNINVDMDIKDYQTGKGNVYSYVPLCEEHFNHIYDKNNEEILYNLIDGGKAYLEIKNHIMIKKWVMDFFIKEFSLTGHEEPDSFKILAWCSNNNLRDYLPQKFVKNALSLAK